MFFQLIFDTNQAPLASTGGSSGSAVLVALGIAVLIVLALFAVRALKGSGSGDGFDPLERAKTKKAWDELVQLAKIGGAPGRKLAVIEADKLVDHTLKKLGFPGETMSDRMKVAEYKHPKVKEMWTAHKWRNQLVHEAHFSLSERQTNEALRAFEAALRSLRMLV